MAALLVFLYHFAPRRLGSLAGVIVGQGHVGVTVFFVLSGFLITVRYHPRFAAGERQLGAYFVRRAARILPLYYVVLTLTHLLSTGSVPVDAAHGPEWTLTHGLLGSSLETLTVPTSWSLTVEECFYALAPLLFLAVAALRRRTGAVAGTLLTLGAATAGLYIAGSLILRSAPALGASAISFLADEPILRSFTIFGRFPDFALGAAAGLLFLSGRVDNAWRRRGGALLSTAVAAVGAALLIAGQAGMARDASNPAAAWRWNLLVVLAAAALILALTCRQAPLTRLLSLRPAVYLGRISYALYLIQLGPLGNHLLYRILPGRDGAHVLILYLGMSLVAALLFELVEEPARGTVLALWRKRSDASLPSAPTRMARGISMACLLGALASQHSLWVLGALPPVDEARVLQVLGADAREIVRAAVAVPTGDGREPRVRLPVSWREGPIGDLLAPHSLLVFVDGQAVPFVGTHPFEGDEAAAYYRRSKTDYVSLQIDEPATVTLVNQTPRVALALTWSRLTEAPVVLIAPLLLLAAAWTAVARRRRSDVWRPRVSIAFAVGLVTVWLVSGVHLQWWAPVVLVLELAVLTWLVLSRRPASSPGPKAALET